MVYDNGKQHTHKPLDLLPTNPRFSCYQFAITRSRGNSKSQCFQGFPASKNHFFIIPTLCRRAILPGFECFSLLKPSFLPSIIHQLFGLSDFVVARRVETKRRATGRDSSQCLTRTAEYEFQGMISTGKNKEASSFWPLVSYHFMYKLSTI